MTEKLPIITYNTDEMLILKYELPTGEVIERTKYGNLYFSALKPYLGMLAIQHVIGKSVDYEENIIIKAVIPNPFGQETLLIDFLDDVE